MKVIFQRGRIRIKPIPTMEGYMLVVQLKKPLGDAYEPFCTTDVEVGKKFYDLPCPIDNIIGVALKYKG